MKRVFLFVIFVLLIVSFHSCSSESSAKSEDKAEEKPETYPDYGEETIGYRDGKDDEKAGGVDENGDTNSIGSDPGEEQAPSSDSSSSAFDEDFGYSEEDSGEDFDEDYDYDSLFNIDEDTTAIKLAGNIIENPFFKASEEPVSTFSIDVDTGSYTLIRSYLNNGELPPAESVRIEEMINYFKYNYPKPEEGKPFSLYTEMGPCPWNLKRKLVMIGVQGDEIPIEDQPPANLVFLIDSSGSMSSGEKLSLLKRGFKMMVNQLRPVDAVSIVTYAGSDRVVLESTTGDQKEKIKIAIDSLRAGGSTNGAGGIQKAYEIAVQNFIKDGNNRVILATDGDFNVGISDTDELVKFIAAKRDSGVFLSVFGFGAAYDGGNYKDEKMEQLADNGNGVYLYIDGEAESRRAFVNGLSGSLLTVAKDVKLQVQFNPSMVKGYRLVGYENRVLDNSDFDNDTVDAGELGSGHNVTAFYEIIPVDSEESVPDDFSGDVESSDTSEVNDDDLENFVPITGETFMDVRIRYKDPDSDESKLINNPVSIEHFHKLPTLKFVFAASVTELGLILRHSQFMQDAKIGSIISRIGITKKADAEGAVAEFIGLVEKAGTLLEE